MAKPTTKAEFKDYIKRKLGAPVLEDNGLESIHMYGLKQHKNYNNNKSMFA